MRICLFVVTDVSSIPSSSSTPLPKCAKEQMRSLQHGCDGERGGVIRRGEICDYWWWMTLMAVMGPIMSRIVWPSLSKSVMLRLECKFWPLLASPFIFHELQPHSLPVRIFRSKSCRLHQFAIFKCHQKWIGFIRGFVGDRVFCFEIRCKLNLVKYELMTKM